MSTKKYHPYMSYVIWAVLLSLLSAVFLLGVSAQKQVDKNLLIAAESNSIRGVRTALLKGADVNARQTAGRRDGTPMVAIAWAVSHKNFAMVTLLAEKRADVNVKSNNSDVTLLMKASSIPKNAHIVEVLLGHGARIDDVDDTRQTALMWATYTDRPKIVKMLLAYGADKSIVSKNNKTVFQIAMERGYTEIVELLVSDADFEDVHTH